MNLPVILVIIFIVLYNYYFYLLNKKVGKLKKLPYFPIIGDLRFFIGSKSFGEKTVNLTEAVKTRYGTCCLWFGPKLLISVQTPDDVKTVLTSPDCIAKASCYNIFSDLDVGNGIAFCKPQIWKLRRKMFNSNFNVLRITSLIENVNEISYKFINQLENYCNKPTFDFLPLSFKLSVDVALNGHFDASYSEVDLEYIANTVLQGMNDAGSKLIDYLTNTPYYLFKKRFLYDLNAFKPLKNSLNNIIQDKYQYFSDENSETEENLRNNPDNFIKRVLRLKFHKLYSHDELLQHMCVVLVGAADTTALAVANTLLALAIHSDIQNKVYNEIKEVLGDQMTDHDVEINMENLHNFEYVDCVVKESLRLFPPAMVMARKASKDIKIENGIIPAGTEIIIQIKNVHTNDQIWGVDAEKFNPDHFLPENINKIHQCNFIPFAYGNRNCIAAHYALNAVKIMIIKICRKYKFSTELKLEQLKFRFSATAILEGGHMMKVEKR